MQGFSFLSLKMVPLGAGQLHDVQAKIAALYGELAQVEVRDETKANEYISAIRALESQVIEIRKAQPGYLLRL